MNRVLLLIILVLAASCNKNPNDTRYRPNHKKLNAVREVRKKVIIRLKEEKELKACGTGAQMMDEVVMIALSFQYDNVVSIEEGRELLISAIDTFLDEVNSNECVRPYLKNYPFQVKNLEIRIFIRNPDRSNVSKNELSVISAIDGILDYEIYDKEEKWLRTVYKESYEQALERPTDITWDPEPYLDRSGDTENQSMEIIFVS